MKKIAILILPALFLFACQTKQEPAKTPAAAGEPQKTVTAEVPKENKKIKVQPPADGQPNKVQPVKPPNNDAKNASVLFKRGLELLDAESYPEAIDYLTRALGEDPKNTRILFNRGFGYFNLKDYDKAQADFNSSMNINPSDTMVVLYSGLTKYYKGDYKGAELDYTNAINLNKRFSIAYYNRGLVRGEKLGNFKGSIDDLTQAIILKPDYPKAYFNRGNAYFFNHDTNNACMDWIQANRMGVPGAQQRIDAYCEKYKSFIK
jgi:tetratricopeptide (TPR) repeat protein